MSRVDWFIRIFFVLSLLIGSRRFLGFKLTGSGLLEMMTSFSMMLLGIITIEYFVVGVARIIVLFFIGIVFISFHLVNGVYYRFFGCLMPPDIFKQWTDLFIVGGDGAALMSFYDFIASVFMPLVFLVLLLLSPGKADGTVFIRLLVIIFVGWGYRLIRLRKIKHEALSIYKKAALTDFVYRTGQISLTFAFRKKRFCQVVQDINSVLPRCLKGYRILTNKGVMVEPVGPHSNSNTKKYNVIVILLESVRAYECGFLGSQPSFTPCLDKLSASARVYDNFYANGTLTVRGEFATMCSIYPNPFGSPVYLINPGLSVISLPEILQKAGYDTLWFSAYTADFHNKRAFLNRHGINKIIDRDVLPKPREPIIGWGMNDKEMFGHVWEIIKDLNEPFFAQITTLSNHHIRGRRLPTDLQAPVISASSEYQTYVRGTYYTDYAVSHFVRHLLESELSANTILVVTSDHGLQFFPNDITDPVQKREIFFRSPLCIWGPPDVVKPRVDHTLGSQIDIAPTLVDMLGIRERNTFLGQSLVNNSISEGERHSLAYLGMKPFFRVGNVFMMPDGKIRSQQVNSRICSKVEKMKTHRKGIYDFAVVEGDPLYGNYNIKHFLDDSQAITLSKRVDDVTFLVGYAIHFNAFMGASWQPITIKRY